MKVVHMNTHTYGGAAVVAKRVHSAMLSKGIDSTLFTCYGQNESSIPKHEFLRQAAIRYYLKNRLSHSRLYPLIKKIQGLRPHPNLANKKEGYEIFSPLHLKGPVPVAATLDETDIIHLHWVNNFINDQLFFPRYASKKFVWTLHDMNPFTGGCHHADGCTRFTDDCATCPQLEGTKDPHYSSIVLSSKEAHLRNLASDQLIITAPSKWLLELSQKSRLTARFRHELVRNPSFDIPELIDNSDIRRRLHLPVDKKIILFVADNLWNKRKGIHLLWEACRQLPDADSVQLVGIGGGSSPPDDLNITFTGSIQDPALMQMYYRAADLFVLPSLAENSPLVIIEALTCGTPVVASNVGGIPELIDNDSGQLFEPDAVQLRISLSTALQKSYDRAAISRRAIERHNPKATAAQFLKIYEKLRH